MLIAPNFYLTSFFQEIPSIYPDECNNFISFLNQKVLIILLNLILCIVGLAYTKIFRSGAVALIYKYL